MLKDKFTGSGVPVLFGWVQEDIYCLNLWHFQSFMQERQDMRMGWAPQCQHSPARP